MQGNAKNAPISLLLGGLFLWATLYGANTYKKTKKD